MHRYTVTRSWGPLLCHSSAANTSCFSMIMDGPVSQGSVPNSCKLNMSQFFYGLHTHQTCHQLSMFGMLWIDMLVSVFQFPPISSNFTHLLKNSRTTFNRSTNSLINSMRRRCVALNEANSSHTKYWLIFWSRSLLVFLNVSVTKIQNILWASCEMSAVYKSLETAECRAHGLAVTLLALGTYCFPPETGVQSTSSSFIYAFNVSVSYSSRIPFF